MNEKFPLNLYRHKCGQFRQISQCKLKTSVLEDSVLMEQYEVTYACKALNIYMYKVNFLCIITNHCCVLSTCLVKLPVK